MRWNSSFLTILLGRIIQGLISFATIRLITTVLHKSEIGNQYLFNSIILWFSLILINPFGMYVNRHIHEWQRNHQLTAALKKMNLYFIAVAIISIPILVLVKEVFLVAENQSTLLVGILVIGYVYFGSWFQSLSSVLNYFNKQKYFIIVNITAQLIGLVSAYLFVSIYSAKSYFWIFGILLGQIFGLILSLYFLKKNYFFTAQDKIEISKPLKIFSKQTLSFCYPIAIATVFLWFQNQGYRLVIEKYLGSESLAGLGVGLGIAASLAAIVESLTTQYLYPQYYKAIANSEKEIRSQAWEKMWRAGISIYIPSAVLVMTISSILIQLLTSNIFHMFKNLIFYGALIELMRQLTIMLYLVSHAENKPHVNILSYLFGAVVLGIGLIYLYQNSNFRIDSICLLLTGSYLVTLVANMVAAYALAQVKFYFIEMFWSFLLMLPVLAFIPVVKQLNLLTILISGLLGMYTLFVIYFRLKKQGQLIT